jgi:hypothetical protein
LRTHTAHSKQRQKCNDSFSLHLLLCF